MAVVISASVHYLVLEEVPQVETTTSFVYLTVCFDPVDVVAPPRFLQEPPSTNQRLGSSSI